MVFSKDEKKKSIHHLFVNLDELLLFHSFVSSVIKFAKLGKKKKQRQMKTVEIQNPTPGRYFISLLR